MPETDGFPSATPGWTDLAAPDIDAAARFYEGLFGWESLSPGPEDQTGGYRIFLKGGKQVAGYGPPGEGEPPSWRTYVIVDDADATVERVRGAGGNVMAQMDVMDQGRMAVFTDPTGAICCLWQPREHKGAQLVSEPGAMSWNELGTRDTAAARSFYEQVFGWRSRDQEMGGITYTTWLLGDHPVGGMLDMRGLVPDDVPPHWLTYFSVEDCDEAVARAAQLRGAELREPVDIPAGRFAIVSDPNGAAFGLIAVSEEAAEAAQRE